MRLNINELNINDNETIILLLSEGDEKVFDFVYRNYYKRLCSFCSQYLEEREEWENIVHDTMLWLWENRTSLITSLSLKTLLFTIVKNKALNHISHSQIQSRVHSEIVNKYQSEFSNPDFYFNNEIFELYNKALESLSPEIRQAFKMNREEHLTHKEISEKLGVSTQTVNYRIGIALKQLRIALKDYIPLIYLASILNSNSGN